MNRQIVVTAKWSAVLLATMVFAVTAEVVTVTPPHVIEGEDKLPLQTRAVREVLWIDVYRIGVYFDDDTSLKGLLRRPADVAVRIEIMTDQLPSEPPLEWQEIFRDHLAPAPSRRLSDEFVNLRPGDVLWFVHDASGDSKITINREQFAIATGYGLMRAMLRLWVGKDPISSPLREDLLEDFDDD